MPKTPSRCPAGGSDPGVFDKLVLDQKWLPDPDCGHDTGSCSAVYHFLEKVCGVRWYGPTEVCTVCPQKPTLAVQVDTVRRVPSFVWRNVISLWSCGDVYPAALALSGASHPRPNVALPLSDAQRRRTVYGQPFILRVLRPFSAQGIRRIQPLGKDNISNGLRTAMTRPTPSHSCVSTARSLSPKW